MADLHLSTGICLASLALIIFILLSRSRRYFRQRTPYSTPGAASRTAKRGPAGHHLDAPPDFQRWEVEMQEMARELAGALNSKMAILQQLIANAEQASSRLESLLDIAESRGMEPSLADEDDFSRQRVERLPLKSPATSESNSRPVLPMYSTAAGAQLGREPLSLKDPRFAPIYALADRGLSPTAIANELGAQIGEVELILSLRQAG